jgi:cobalamin biosynthetic protein CobC
MNEDSTLAAASPASQLVHGQPAPEIIQGTVAHGGDLSAVRAAYDGDWLDLSTGINPLAYPLPMLAQEAWTRLPGAEAMVALLQAARVAYGVPAGAGLIAAPGTQAAIQLLPFLFPTSRIAILGPTYAEHAHVWRASGHHVAELDGLPGTLKDIDILLAVNPNNPDGRALDLPLLRGWHGELAARGGTLILDEAFVDVVPEISLCADAGAPGLVILRSFGKFFGLAGLRLGFLIGQPDLTGTVHEAMGPWAVSGPALQIGAAALNDAGWQVWMRDELHGRSRRFDQGMRDRGIHVLGGTALFRLAKINDAAGFAQALHRQGIHVRIFEQQPQWMRFGLPADEAEFWRRLDLVLRDFSLQG